MGNQAGRYSRLNADVFLWFFWNALKAQRSESQSNGHWPRLKHQLFLDCHKTQPFSTKSKPIWYTFWQELEQTIRNRDENLANPFAIRAENGPLIRFESVQLPSPQVGELPASY